jgi:hypothetical protein
VPTSCALLAGAALGLIAVAGCGSRPDNAAPRATATTTTTATATATVTATAQSQSPSPRVTTAACGTSQVRLRLLPGGGAAGSSYFTLRMTNTSAARACTTNGFGGVSLVGSAAGKPIGAPADRTQSGTARRVLLQPGQHADATLREVQAGDYPAATCHPVRAAGVRVYPPGETHSTFLAHVTTACSAAGVHLLSLTPYAASH